MELLPMSSVQSGQPYSLQSVIHSILGVLGFCPELPIRKFQKDTAAIYNGYGNNRAVTVQLYRWVQQRKGRHAIWSVRCVLVCRHLFVPSGNP